MKTDSDEPTQTPEEIIAQIARLMAEAEALVDGPEAERTGERFLTLRERLDDLQERVADAYSHARRHVITTARAAEEAIRTHPYKSVAIALGIGVLLGAALRSSHDD